jgi:hypothetical protein
VSDAKEPIERAKEVLVYGPVGLALYLRDTAPSFMKVFVARGRAELDQQRRTVGDQLGQARNVGASATDSTAPQLLRLVAEGIERVRETAEGAFGTISGWTGESVSWSPDASDAPEAQDTPMTEDAPMAGDAPMAEDAGPAEPSGGTGGAAAADTLAIADYDELSASQVVDRLEGLAPGDLAAIRDYERASRARATILGKIEQLERPA